MNRSNIALPLLLIAASLLLAGCGGGSDSTVSGPLAPANVNLVFVVSEDLDHHGLGDVDPNTANLTPQGYQRTLLTATFLQRQVLGSSNVSGIYALSPMTHLQTANKLPDMAAIVGVQQFALMNQIALLSNGTGSQVITANSYPINVGYAPGSTPDNVVTPPPILYCAGCQGLAFDDTAANNVALATGIVNAKAAGFYVFSAPWRTISALMASLNDRERYHFRLPTSYAGPNTIYAMSIAPSGTAKLVTYDSGANPPSSFPVLPPPPLASASCAGPGTPPPLFTITATPKDQSADPAKRLNANETVYMVRHAEAHPASSLWDDGNFVAPGQWRALQLPNALRGKISPDVVYSIDPAQAYPGAVAVAGSSDWSYVRPALTIAPYVIANNLPYYLVSDFALFALDSPTKTVDFFFKGGKFSNRTVLIAWEHAHFPPILDALLANYQAPGQSAPNWPDDDYDTIWTVKLDAAGNLTAANAMCEGINSASLPTVAPSFAPF